LSIEEIESRLEMQDQIDNNGEEQWRPHPNFEDVEFDHGMRVPGELWDCLFDYQKTCKYIMLFVIATTEIHS
jgi:DNA excision repair protein ERCC-6